VKGNGNVDRNVEQQCGESLNTLWRQAGDEACIAAEMYLPNFQDRCCGIGLTGRFLPTYDSDLMGESMPVSYILQACISQGIIGVHLIGVYAAGMHLL
jgi:hypothetical protein